MPRGVPKYPPLPYPRYSPGKLRPRGSGAFFDFAAYVARGEVVKLQSCSVVRHWGHAVAKVPEEI